MRSGTVEKRPPIDRHSYINDDASAFHGALGFGSLVSLSRTLLCYGYFDSDV